MNFFDNEQRIIDFLQDTSYRKMIKTFSSYELYLFLDSIHNRRKYLNWINSSGKNELPPDFYSDKYKYMVEVMRVDDYEIGSNCPNALEAKALNKIKQLRGIEKFKEDQKNNITYIMNPDLTDSSDHNYKIYIDNFHRILNSHIEKIGNYKKNHPNFKLGFIVFDESAGYLHVDEKDKKIQNCYEKVYGYRHFYWLDKNLVESFINADIDFLIWLTPNKNMPQNKEVYPNGAIFDLKKLQKNKNDLITYDEDQMISLEV